MKNNNNNTPVMKRLYYKSGLQIDITLIDANKLIEAMINEATIHIRYTADNYVKHMINIQEIEHIGDIPNNQLYNDMSKVLHEEIPCTN